MNDTICEEHITYFEASLASLKTVFGDYRENVDTLL